MDREIEAVKGAILSSGLDDWVHIAEIVFAARQASVSDHPRNGRSEDTTLDGDQVGPLTNDWLTCSERHALPSAISAVKELLRDGLVRVGETSESGFAAWGGSLREIEARIDDAVREAIFPLLPGHLFWIENTPAGDEVARSRHAIPDGPT